MKAKLLQSVEYTISFLILSLHQPVYNTSVIVNNAIPNDAYDRPNSQSLKVSIHSTLLLFLD